MKPFYWLAHTLVHILAKLYFRIDIIGRENTIEEGPALLVCNHTSHLDPPLASLAYKNEIHFLARKSLFKGIFGHLIRNLNAFPIDRDSADLSSLKKAIQLLKKGNRLLLFPEGSRSYDGQLQPGLPGIGLIVAKTHVPIIPMRLFGAERALPRGKKWIRPTKITLVVGPPIASLSTDKKGREGYQEIADNIMAAIGALALPIKE